MDNKEYLKEIPIKDLVDEFERRFPIGVVVMFITDDPSFNEFNSDDVSDSEFIRVTGSPSIKRGMIETLRDTVRQDLDYNILQISYLNKNGPIGIDKFGFFDEDDEDDDEFGFGEGDDYDE